MQLTFEEIEQMTEWFCYYTYSNDTFHILPINEEKYLYNSLQKENRILFEGKKQECQSFVKMIRESR